METEIKERGRRSYREGKHRLRSIRWMLFWIVAVQTAVTGVIALISSFFSAPPPAWVQILLIELFAYLVPLSLYARQNRLLTAKTARERFGLCVCKRYLWPFVILGGIGCQFVMIVLNLPVNLLLGQVDDVLPQTVPELLASLVAVAVIPAFFEEFLFRGIVYGVMKEFNTRAALLFTTVMFALMHGSVSGFLGYLFLGWALVVVLSRTGSLYACMAFHLVNNLTALLLSWFSYRLSYLPGTTLFLFVLGILAAALGYLGIVRMTKEKQETKLLETKELLGQSFLSLPIVLCLICMLVVWLLG